MMKNQEILYVLMMRQRRNNIFHQVPKVLIKHIADIHLTPEINQETQKLMKNVNFFIRHRQWSLALNVLWKNPIIATTPFYDDKGVRTTATTAYLSALSAYQKFIEAPVAKPCRNDFHKHNAP